MNLYVIIPAAGLSRRMGRPKLTLELGGRSVIARLLDALNHPAITATVVVYRRSDESLHAELQTFDVIAVQPAQDPPDMRSSVEHGVAELNRCFSPKPDDAWLLIPADHPVLDADVVSELISAWSVSDADVMVPVCNGRRGHPAFFRWSLTSRLADIPADQGLNWLLKSGDVTVREEPVDSDAILLDLDTPKDYASLQQRFRE